MQGAARETWGALPRGDPRVNCDARRRSFAPRSRSTERSGESACALMDADLSSGDRERKLMLTAASSRSPSWLSGYETTSTAWRSVKTSALPRSERSDTPRASSTIRTVSHRGTIVAWRLRHDVAKNLHMSKLFDQVGRQ